MRLRLFRKGGRRTRFAWLPKRLSNNTVVWLEWYQRYRLHEEPSEDDEPENEAEPLHRAAAATDTAAPDNGNGEPQDSALARPAGREAPL